MDSDTRVGVNEQLMPELCSEINKYADDIAAIFSKVDDNIEDLKNYYTGSSFNEFISSYNDFRKNYAIVKSNVNVYADDLAALVIKLKSGLLDISKNLARESEDIKTKAKAVE